jgi:hypothetical protein
MFLPREFQPAGESFDARVQFLGPLLGDREQREPWSPLHPELPVLFISLGSIFVAQPELFGPRRRPGDRHPTGEHPSPSPQAKRDEPRQHRPAFVRSVK